MLQKFMATGITVCCFSFTFGQDSTTTSSLSVTGNADIYYKYDRGQNKNNNLTSFTSSHNSFEPGMVSIKLDYKSAKVEMVADLGLGKRAQEFSYNDDGILQSVKQLYISYSAKDWLKLTAGSWATHVGYEVVDPPGNRNYSMSYMFTNGPFFHTGIRAELTHQAHGLMIGISNPTDFKYMPDGYINKKFLIAQYSYSAGDYFKAYLNYTGGENIDTTKTKQVDLVITSKLNDRFSIAYNGTINSTHKYLGNKTYAGDRLWWGSAVYLNFDPNKHFGLTLREEYFSDEHQLKIYSSQLTGGSVMASTLSANFKLDHFIFIPEVRLDAASEPIFIDHHNKSTTKAASIVMAAIYQF
jgi:hypothetical protein